MSDVLDYQVGGDHYDMPIQPADFILKNGLGWAEGNAIKYLCRYKRKGTPVEDLKKAKHYIEMLIEQNSPTQAAESNSPYAQINQSGLTGQNDFMSEADKAYEEAKKSRQGEQ